MGGGFYPFALLLRRSHSTKELEYRTTESTRQAVATGVFTEEFTEYSLPPLAGHPTHVAVERGPSAHHLLIGYDGLIGLAFEIESVEGWHAVMLSFEGDDRQKRRRAPNLTAAKQTERERVRRHRFRRARTRTSTRRTC